MHGVVPGVAFRLFPQDDGTYREPERVVIAALGGRIGPGPCDDHMRVVDAVGKAPYDPPSWMPPWTGPVAPPARPAPHGGFDHLPIDSRAFLQAHLFGCARLALNVWTAYLGRPVRWQAERFFPMLELVPLVEWPNAQSGPGFLETGAMQNDEGELRLFCLNLDVIAHEIGHTVLFSVLGLPAPGRLTAQFLAFHEAMADITTLLVALQFDSVLDRVLSESDGNLYALNEINRIAELSSTQQVRVADNKVRMADVAGITLTEDGTWVDRSGLNRNAHALAEPLTGALFDMFVTLFQNHLVARGLIAPDDDPNGWTEEEILASLDALRATHRHALDEHGLAFRDALVQARDDLGLCLAEAISRIPADDFTFDQYAGVLMEVCLARLGRRSAIALDESLRWRGITPRRLPRPQARPARALRPMTLRGKVDRLCCGSHRHIGPGFSQAGLGELGLTAALAGMVRRDHRAPS